MSFYLINIKLIAVPQLCPTAYYKLLVFLKEDPTLPTLRRTIKNYD